MKRDFELIKQILTDIEDTPADESPYVLSYSGYDEYTVYEHLVLLLNARLIDGEILGPIHEYEAPILVKRLTWQGHDFLDATRDPTIWSKAKEVIIKPGVSFTFNLLMEWVKSEAKTKLGLP